MSKNNDKLRKAYARVVADNDQDRAAALEFFRTTRNDHLAAVWLYIQAMPDTGVEGVVARLAQLAFGELAAEVKGGIRG